MSEHSVMWFRRELRLEDNPALLDACSAGTDGMVLTRTLRKYVTRGEGIMKIVGTTPLPARKGGYLLED